MVTAIESPFTRDILDGLVALAKFSVELPDASVLTRTYYRCLDVKDWCEIETFPATLEETLWSIRMELVCAAGNTGSPVVVPMLTAAVDEDLEPFAIESIKRLRPVAVSSLPRLMLFVRQDEWSHTQNSLEGSRDIDDYLASLRRDACFAIDAIGTPDAFDFLQRTCRQSHDGTAYAARGALDLIQSG